MEDMEETRRILEEHNWDLLSAISSHLGLDPGTPERVPMARQENIPPLIDDHVVSRPSRPVPGRGREGFFNRIWAFITRPMEMVFQFVWDFIGFGLRFIRADPRRGVYHKITKIN
jgi:hypothetical protein